MIVSVFAKSVDKSRASVSFSEQQLDVDLPMPANQRCKVSFPLYGIIDPSECQYKVLTTKVELKLKKGIMIALAFYLHIEISADVLLQGTGRRGQH